MGILVEMTYSSVEQELPAADRYCLPEGGISLEDVEKDLILQALEKTHHNKNQAAKLLRISYDSIRYHM